MKILFLTAQSLILIITVSGELDVERFSFMLAGFQEHE